MRFFPGKLIKYQTQIYRIVFQCKFLESDNFYFFGFRLKTSQLLFQAMPARAHRGTAFMSMFQCCFLWDSDKVYQNLIFDTFVINDPHQFFNTSKVNTQNIVFCIKCFFLATSFTRFSAISFCFLAVISKPNVQFREFKDKKFDFGSYLVISIEKTQGNSV